MSSLMRFGLVALLVVASAVAAGTAAVDARAGSVTRTVKVAAQITGLTIEGVADAGRGDGSTVPACSYVHVIEFSEVAGATGYQFEVTDAAFGGSVRTLAGTPASFEDVNFSALGQTKRPPAGKRWVGLSGGSGSGDANVLVFCAETAAAFASRYVLLSAVATVVSDPDKGTIEGRVVETSCSETECAEAPLAGVTVSAGSASASTGADGTYQLEVDPGSYTVRPSLADRMFDPTSRTVRVAKGGKATASFTTCALADGASSRSLTAAAACRTAITGTVVRWTCGAGSDGGCSPELRPVAERPVELTAADGTRSETETDRNGNYRFEVRPGSYTVRLPGDGKAVEPKTRTVEVGTTSVRGMDFMLCKRPEGTKAKLACGPVRIEGTAVDIDGQPFPGAILRTRDSAATTSTSGAFTLFTTSTGRVDIAVTGEVGATIPGAGRATVTVRRGQAAVTGVKVKVRPQLGVRVSDTRLRVVGVTGVPIASRGPLVVEFITKHRPLCSLPTLLTDATIRIDGSRPPGTGSVVPTSLAGTFFCDGPWTATLLASDRVLVRLPVMVSPGGGSFQGP